MAKSEQQETPSGSGTGTIKSYSSRHGYGFIENDETGVDLHFQSESLPVQWTVLGPKLVGTKVMFEAANSGDGRPQARKIEPGSAPVVGDQCAGQVKNWFDSKGYGFLTVPGLEGDVIFVRNKLPENVRDLRDMNDCIYIFELAASASGDEGKFQAINIMLPDARDLGKNFKTNEDNRNASNGERKRPLPSARTPNAQRLRTDERLTGSLKNYFDNKGFGFIVVPGYPDDIIFQGQDFPDLDSCSAGEVVSFTTRVNDKGNPQAINLTIGEGSGGNNRITIRKEGVLKDVVANGPGPMGGASRRLEEAKLVVERLDMSELAELCVHSSMMLRMRINSSM